MGLIIEEAADLHPERNSCIRKTDAVSLAVFLTFTLTLTLIRMIRSTTLQWKVA